MKFSKSIIFLFALCSILSITFASELTLLPANGDMGDGCSIAVDVIADTNGETVAAADVIMESSMEFLDFVPGSTFPYFLPPKVESTVVHIVGFAVEPTQRVSGKVKVGTAYFKKRSIGDRDGAIRLYFTKIGETIDSNLSIAGGVDTLEKVSGANFTFDGTTECSHEVAPISGGIQNLPMDALLEKISRDIPSKNHVYLYRLSGVLVLIIVSVFYFAKTRKGKKVA